MNKHLSFVKLVYLVPLLLVALFLDLIIFAAANACTSCSSFPHYITSSYSFAQAVFLSITAILINKKS
ncbi:hypothetical protein HYT02_06010 [Candidatus Gottesmanbacteria bacterium]|nr:hypothetical protein [Candidatus Gottesmanbacteria bacterium]